VSERNRTGEKGCVGLKKHTECGPSLGKREEGGGVLKRSGTRENNLSLGGRL